MKVFGEHNFLYPVEITVVEDGLLEGFPWIRPTDFLKAMSDMNDLCHLLGGHSLESAGEKLTDFWGKFRSIVPQHELWSYVDRGEKDLRRCVPILLHGDEGVSFKKSGILVLSFQGAFGYGSNQRGKNIEEIYRAMGEGIPLNFLKTGVQTRMLILVCQKEWVYETFRLYTYKTEC